MKQVKIFLVAGLLLIGIGFSQSAICAEKIDVVFGIDLTGSMGGAINQVKTDSAYIMNEIASLIPDCGFGVISIVDYPSYYCSYGYCSTYGSAATGDYAYRTDLDITINRTDVVNALNGLSLRWGADGPQNYVRMLYESQFLSWREGATRILVVFGDAPAHDNDLFSQSYGGDPGRDEIMFTSDDLDYQTVIRQLKEEAIIVVSVDSGGSISGIGYLSDIYLNFEYMARETGGRHFLLANAAQIPEAIFELIEGCMAEEFVWQQIAMDGEVYTVKVKANQVPDDVSTYVYPLYCGECNPDYEPRSIAVLDSSENVVADEETKRKVLSLARNSALYRSWNDISNDPIPILEKLSGFDEVSFTPAARYCFLGWWPCWELEGGKDTSFGYSYPGHLIFPKEYVEINGVARLIDWGWDDVLVQGAMWGGIDYIHPLGIYDTDQRKKIYIKLLHNLILQSGVSELDGAAGLLSLLGQVADHLQTIAGAAETAAAVADVVECAVDYADVSIGLKNALSTLKLNYTDLNNMSNALGAQHHYTGIAKKLAPKMLSAIGVVLQVAEAGFRVGGDALASLTFAIQLQDHGAAVLQALDNHLFSLYSGDPTLCAAFWVVQNEFSENLRQDFLELLTDKFLELSAEHGAEYVLDTVQVGLGVTSIVATGTIAGVPVAGLCVAVNAGISVLRFAGGLVVDKLEHEEQQQAVVACSTLEYAWWEKPLKNHALTQLLVSGPSESDFIEELNWLVSTKLFQGTFVVDKVLEENSDFIDDIREWLGDEVLTQRRSELNNFRQRLINVFFGRGDTDVDIGRLAGRPTADGDYIGFVPKKELDFLVELTKPGSALAGHSLTCLLHSPGEIGVVDPAGRHMGAFARHVGGGNFTVEELTQIPGGIYSGNSSDPRELIIPEPIRGDYKIYLTGTGTGPYTLEVQVYTGDILLSESKAYGTFEPGRLEDGVVSVEASLGGFGVEITSLPVPRGIITGTLTDGSIGNPLGGARVTAGGMTDITKYDGTFEILNVPSGTLTITGVATGYITYSGEIALGPGESLVHDIALVSQDSTPPDVKVLVPYAGEALQDGVTLTVNASDSSGVDDVYLSLREDDGGTDVPIGHEDMKATLNQVSGKWEYALDTTQLADGYYIILAKAVDAYLNEAWSELVSCSIRNWAVVELLPNTANNKAGRTMPVKFALRIAAAVDPAQPFVYNEELEIRIYDASVPDTILQTSLYGGGTSTDYRIDTDGELYITNFKTSKKPAEYVVEIWRISKNFLVGNFTFETVK